MKHIKAINGKAQRIEVHLAGEAARAAAQDGHDVVGLESGPDGPSLPLGCTFIFSPGWETDSSGGTAGLCQPVERDLFDCHLGCFWPAQVPDQLNHAPDWIGSCAAAQKDWRNIDLVFP
ncbi:MAG: quinohemoprotein amine dehydrogenase subunit gamma [Gemmatimonadota bacterium]